MRCTTSLRWFGLLLVGLVIERNVAYIPAIIAIGSAKDILNVTLSGFSGAHAWKYGHVSE